MCLPPSQSLPGKAKKLNANWAFDQKLYQELNSAREETVREIVTSVKDSLGLETAVDVGCGVGHFTNFLSSLRLRAVGVDARQENVEEARRRYPNLQFEVKDAEDPELLGLGTFDLVFCFGLLYHLENPFRMLRILSSMTRKLALLEGICYPSDEPVMVLIDEDHLGDQGVNYVAYYPSEACLFKMLHCSGFSECFHPSRMPRHFFYQPGGNTFRYRTIIAASKTQVSSSVLTLQPQTASDLRSWRLKPMRALGPRTDRVVRLLKKYLEPRDQAQ